MRIKHAWGLTVLVCVLSVTWLLGTPVANAAGPVADEATNFVLIGKVDVASGGSPANSRAYSKIAPWPDTQDQTFNTGCYESGINPDMPGCFRVIDVSEPYHPKRIATVEVYDREKSPLPPVPTDPYWATPGVDNVWSSHKFDNTLVFSTSCGDWAVNKKGKHIGPGWIDTKNNPTCWDKGWITRTHFTAGVSGDFKAPDMAGGCDGKHSGKRGSTIYWVNSQRQSGAPANRLGYTGVAFYDLKDPSKPKFLSRIDLQYGRLPNGTTRTPGGVHHGFFDGRYAFLGGGEDGWTGDHLVIVDAKDPKHPKIVGRWWVPGQKDDELAIRNDANTYTDPVTGMPVQRGWKPGKGFAPIYRDSATGLLSKDISFHWMDLRHLNGKDIAFISYHEAGLVILDVTDRTNPQFISRFDYLTPEFQAADTLPGAQIDHLKCEEVNGVGYACGNAHSGKLVPGTNIFWLTDEYFTLPYGHLRFFDVSDLTKPVLLSHMMLPETTDSNITYAKRTASTHLGNTYGDVLFLAYYGLGVKAFNFTDPKDPKLVGTYSYTVQDGVGGQATYDAIFDPYGNICVSDSVDGVRILRYTGPGGTN